MKFFSMAAFLIPFLFFLSPTVQMDGSVEWLSPVTHDFGDLKRNVPVTHDFRFKNTGDAPLTIDNVRSSCGCTAIDWQQEAIAPGSEGTIAIEYDAKREGYFYKKITVFFSTQRKGEKLYIEGYVE